MLVDIKGLGYLTSIVSVVLLGAVAWPQPGDPDWVQPALIAGIVASIIGIVLRYVAHLKERKELKRVERASGT